MSRHAKASGRSGRVVPHPGAQDDGHGRVRASEHNTRKGERVADDTKRVFPCRTLPASLMDMLESAARCLFHLSGKHEDCLDDWGDSQEIHLVGSMVEPEEERSPDEYGVRLVAKRDGKVIGELFWTLKEIYAGLDRMQADLEKELRKRMGQKMPDITEHPGFVKTA